MKLYVVVRSDLRPGLQAAQACHALHAFSHLHPEVDEKWAPSPNLVVLQVRGEKEVRALAIRSLEMGVPCAVFEEPDLGGEATALCGPLPPCLVSSLPLLLRDATSYGLVAAE
jgi:peptidyl-tRNA hydrolase